MEIESIATKDSTMPFYKLSNDAVLETFEEGALVLLLRDRHLVELNSSAAEIVSLLDGQRTPEQVATEISKNHVISHDYPITRIIQDVLELCKELNRIGIIDLQPND
jgi:hypothetical protein